MSAYLGKVVDFHRKFKIDYTGDIRDLPPELAWRREFLNEELREYEEAWGQQDLAKQFDALIDLTYVALGTFHLHGGTTHNLKVLNDLNPQLLQPKQCAGPVNGKEMKVFTDIIRWTMDQYDKTHISLGLYNKLNQLEYICMTCMNQATIHQFPWHLGFMEVHKANMAKRLSLPGEGRGENDIVKPKGWKAPDIQKVLDDWRLNHFKVPDKAKAN